MGGACLQEVATLHHVISLQICGSSNVMELKNKGNMHADSTIEARR